MSNQTTSSHEEQGLNAKEKMIRGSLWMTIGSVLSRLLGAVYIIPWYAWMGEHGKIANGLFSKGYNVYAIFLMIATAGIPGAVAKQLSHYNSLNEYGISRRLFKRTIAVMAVFGVLFSGVMYFLAPILADGNPNLVPVMRSLSWAVLIFPSMSVIRGYFQGNQNMMPSAVSQVIEQIARVFYMLLMTFIIMKVRQGDYVDAVIQSTFAAFIGMIGAYATLLYFYYKQKPEMDRLVAGSNNQVNFANNKMVKEIVKQAIPFTIVGSGITLFKLVDQFTFERIMSGFTNYSEKQLEALFTLFSANPDKLIMITISLATGVAMTSLPLVTEYFTLNNKKGLSKLISDNIQLLLFVMIPATFGMIVLAKPMYVLFYEPDVLGINLLIQSSVIGLIMGYFILVSTTLQGVYKNVETIVMLVIGLVIKLLLQQPLVKAFEVYGPLVATAIGLGVSSILITRSINKVAKLEYLMIVRRTMLIVIFSLIMALVTWLCRLGLSFFLNPEIKGQAMVIVLVSVIVGVAVYGYLALKVRLADHLVGPKIQTLRHKLKIK
ncbi:putative polysaccharide biosynthesis protein [Vagococcus sp.]|uniref:putative polysaccharide biosynthesis protein n=1 Tax=Vagococcus sp. TaxID=1933889 RepID=UPI003F9DCF71